MRTVVYKSVKRVYYAVTKKQIGSIPKDTALLGLSGFDKKEVEQKMFDFFFNQKVNSKDLKICTGFVPGELTNHRVYSTSDWIDSEIVNFGYTLRKTI